MNEFKFELNKEGVKELLKSSEMQNGIESIAEAASGRAGEGYGHHVAMGKTRVTAFVKAETVEAGKDNLQNNTILRSIQG